MGSSGVTAIVMGTKGTLGAVVGVNVSAAGGLVSGPSSGVGGGSTVDVGGVATARGSACAVII